MSRIENPEESFMGWWKSGICGPGPYSVEALPGAPWAFFVVDSKGVNCWTKGTGQISSTQDEATAVANHWNGEKA